MIRKDLSTHERLPLIWNWKPRSAMFAARRYFRPAIRRSPRSNSPMACTGRLTRPAGPSPEPTETFFRLSRSEKFGRGGTDDELVKPLIVIQRVQIPPDQSRADRSVVSLAIHRATGGCEA